MLLSAADKNSAISVAQINDIVGRAVGELSRVEKVLVIHNDYSRRDYSERIIPQLYRELEKKGLRQFDTINASGTHRAMSEDEIIEKIGISKDRFPLIGTMRNHEFDNPEQLEHIVDLSAEFISEKTNGNLKEVLSVGVNRLLLDNYDLIVAVNGTIPHESLGYSGGTKMFFPGVSNPGVIALLHWAAVLMGVPSIIGLADNPARDVVNEGTKHIFERIGNTPILSLNMVYAEDKDHNVVPKGLFAAYGFEGFKEAHHHAAKLSSELHIVKVARPLRKVVQRLPKMYDEVWTAGKGSYKLQRKGVLADGAEIILYGPHITCFHSNARMDQDIRRIGYHGLAHVLEFCRKHPEFDKNVAAHVINVRGLGELVDGEERFPFDVTLATGISEKECRDVGLGYRHPDSIKEEDFKEADSLWIPDGGQWLYAA